MQPIDNTQDIIDSRDVIERIEELEADLEGFEDKSGNEYDDLSQELEALKALQEQADSSPDWIHGETLIRRSYFEQYIADLIDDCYDLNITTKNEWPYRHLKLDIEAAAEEAEQDYTEVTFGGVEYLIRA